RPDVVAFVSDVLKEPMRISGEPIANLVASTSGTDSDWVVKLIDVYPDEVGGDEALGGYQLMIAADIFRGRYRENFAKAGPLTPGGRGSARGRPRPCATSPYARVTNGGTRIEFRACSSVRPHRHGAEADVVVSPLRLEPLPEGRPGGPGLVGPGAAPARPGKG